MITFLLTYASESDIFVLIRDKYITFGGVSYERQIKKESQRPCSRKTADDHRGRLRAGARPLILVFGCLQRFPSGCSDGFLELLVSDKGSSDDSLHYCFRCLYQAANESNITRRLNPRLGYLGFLGLLGFCGFWTYHVDQRVFPFAFFLFFGFFGFYYEGKMSGTFMDERFRENAVRAQLTALKVMCSFTVLAFAVLCQGKLFGNVHYTLIVATVILALALALGLFLSEYLLYRYDHDDHEQYEETEG